MTTVEELTDSLSKRTNGARRPANPLSVDSKKGVEKEPRNPNADSKQSLLKALFEAVRLSNQTMKHAKEDADIYLARKGAWAGKPSWVDYGTERIKPLPIPKNFLVEALSGAELRVALRFGYLSFPTMTRDQIGRYKEATHEQEIEAAEVFFEKLLAAQQEEIVDTKS